MLFIAVLDKNSYRDLLFKEQDILKVGFAFVNKAVYLNGHIDTVRIENASFGEPAVFQWRR